MKPQKTRVVVWQTALIVTARYNPGSPATQLDPPEESGFEIEEVVLEKCPVEDIQGLLSDEAIADIEEQLEAQYEEDRRDDYDEGDR